MLISCALFAGSTHAWFSDRCSAYVATVTAAEDFGVNVVKESESESEPAAKMLPTSGVYHLKSGTYTVTLTWRGKGETGGYYKITVGSNEYYSPNLTEEFSFTLEITLPEGEESVSVTFTPVQSDVAQPQGALVISDATISYPAGEEVQTTSLMSAPSMQESDEPKQPESGEGKENTSGEEGGSIGSGSSGPETGENAGDAKDSSEVKQPEVIPEMSPAELSKDSSENQ